MTILAKNHNLLICNKDTGYWIIMNFINSNGDRRATIEMEADNGKHGKLEIRDVVLNKDFVTWFNDYTGGAAKYRKFNNARVHTIKVYKNQSS